MSGTATSTHAITTARAQGFSAVASGWCQFRGSRPFMIGPIRW
jgi:hypothetical protein